jgi:peptide-methionine (S)-S-oxide reductase
MNCGRAFHNENRSLTDRVLRKTQHFSGNSHFVSIHRIKMRIAEVERANRGKYPLYLRTKHLYIILMKRLQNKSYILMAVLLAISALPAFSRGTEEQRMAEKQSTTEQNGAGKNGLQTAVIGGGCFWCIEAVFERIAGIESAVSGYAGGNVPDPTYQQVTTGTTGHAEVVELTYDPAVISYEEILELFWQAHDPTTLNRQGADVGSQYRSIILYGSEEQRQAAEKSIAGVNASGKYPDKAVTEVVPLTRFYKAEDYHQDYYVNNTGAGYCRLVITPKLKKLGLD